MSAGIYNLTIEQGTDWNLLFVWKDNAGVAHDLTGYSARMQIRETIDSKLPLLCASTDAGSILLGGVDGTVEISFSENMTKAVKINPALFGLWQDGKEGALFVYDLEIINSDGKVRRLLQGAVFFVPEVTR
jgi:hypothetical protein